MVEADGKTYYGILTDSFELDCYGKFKVYIIFMQLGEYKLTEGLKQDMNGFTLINFLD